MEERAKLDVGLRLRQIRKLLAKNQTDFAKALGDCSQTFVSGIETGASGPSASVLAGLERLGYSGSWLMSGEGSMCLPVPMIERVADGTGPAYGLVHPNPILVKRLDSLQKKIAKLSAELASLTVEIQEGCPRNKRA